MKRQLAAFDIYVIAFELQNLIGSYIEKIYQLSNQEILIKIRNKQKKKESIFIRNGKLICRTEKNIVTPMTPSTFAMTLRKYLSNARIQTITQHEFDRIIIFECQKGPKTVKLIIELFSQGNIILVNENDRIILPFSKEKWSHRVLKSREEYKPPPSQQNPLTISKESFFEILQKSDADIVRTLASQLNMGGAYAEELCKKAEIDKNQSISSFSQDELDRLFDTFKNIIDTFKQHLFQPVLVKDNEEIIDVLPFRFISYDKVTFEDIPQMIKGLETAITDKDSSVQTENSAVNKKQQKLHRMLSQQQQAIEKLKEKIEKKQIEGELIYLHFKECDQILSTIQQGLNQKEKKELIKEVQQHPLVKTFNPYENTLIVTLNDLEQQRFDVSLDFRKSVAENAENAYNMSKKLKQKRQGAKQAAEETKKRIKQMKKQTKTELQQGIQIRKKPKKKLWFETYRWCISSNGNLIIGGKDAKTNDQIVKKHMQKDDRYAHADVHGAPSCIIKNTDINDKPIEITDQTLTEACIFSACYSKAWKQFTEAQAYWVLPNQVSKTPQSGEYVPRGAFIIRGSRHFCNCKLEMGIGKTRIENMDKIMGGPISAIKKWCFSFVIIKPGRTSKTDAAHQIAERLKVSSDEINKVLPPGEISINSIHLKQEEAENQ